MTFFDIITLFDCRFLLHFFSLFYFLFFGGDSSCEIKFLVCQDADESLPRRVPSSPTELVDGFVQCSETIEEVADRVTIQVEDDSISFTWRNLTCGNITTIATSAAGLRTDPAVLRAQKAIEMMIWYGEDGWKVTFHAAFSGGPFALKVLHCLFLFSHDLSHCRLCSPRKTSAQAPGDS